MTPLTDTELEKSFLLDQFRDFYKEIIAQKEKIAETDTRRQHDPGYEIRQHLMELLKRQEIEAQQYGKGYGLSFYKEAQYVMAILADEIFIHDIGWDAAEAWKDDLLEFRFFNTNSAGELFFQKTDDLLKDADPRASEIAGICFWALSLGFKGKYRGGSDSGELDHYRERLFRFIFHKNPNTEAEHLFLQSYQHTLTEGSGRRLSYLKGFLYAIMASFAGFLIISFFVWSGITDELMQIVDRIGRL